MNYKAEICEHMESLKQFLLDNNLDISATAYVFCYSCKKRVSGRLLLSGVPTIEEREEREK